MGQAIELFEGAQAMVVPRTRFRPVKTTSDLLVLRSDRFGLDEECQVIELGSGPTPVVTLDKHYSTMADFDARVESVPSLLNCHTLKVAGDVTFGDGVVCLDDVAINASTPARIENRILQGLIEC